MTRKVVAGLLLGAGSALIVLLLAWARVGGLDEIDLRLYDWSLRRLADPAAVNHDIVLVEINDATIRDYADAVGRWPWPRVLQSNLIDFLQRAPARVIAYDIQLTEKSRGSFQFGDDPWTAEESDDAMVTSVRSAGNVVMLVDATSPGMTGNSQQPGAPAWSSTYRLGSLIEERPVILPPFQKLTDASFALGHNFLALDDDGIARRITPFIRNGDRYLPSLGVAAALAAGGFKPNEVALEGNSIRVRDRRIPLIPIRVADAVGARDARDQWTMLVNYRAPVQTPAGRPYQTFEARHLLVSQDQLLAGQKPLVDPAVFKNKIVFVGLTGAGLVDVFQTPMGGGLMPGIQLHATVADSLLADRFINVAPVTMRVVSTAGAAILVGLMAALLPFAAAAAGAMAAAAAWTLTAVVTLQSGTWLNAVLPLSATALALLAGTAYRYFVEDYQKRVVKKLFGRYVSKDVFDQLIAHPDRAELGGQRRDMSVLFSDIRGFTTVTEKGNAEALVTQLNEYFSRMVEIVFRHQGTVDKFVGDMVMALFGAPVDDPNHAEHAVATAIDMVRELGELNSKWAARGTPQLDIGIGVNSGDMIAGNIGSSSIMSYTVIGDNVNLGARLESLNKDYGSRIIISDASRTRLTGHYDIRPLGDVVVKGKTKPVAIYEVVVPSPIHESGHTV
ncbi:MAG TPA: adenylate/guanylate cyclase domain-containing protein [Vicinamibacterales bacterium]|nr:adenylate/guanylate cyclase domain-containing protein [Vicinamibacterales bacterium]